MYCVDFIDSFVRQDSADILLNCLASRLADPRMWRDRLTLTLFLQLQKTTDLFEHCMKSYSFCRKLSINTTNKKEKKGLKWYIFSLCFLHNYFGVSCTHTNSCLLNPHNDLNSFLYPKGTVFSQKTLIAWVTSFSAAYSLCRPISCSVLGFLAPSA